MLIPQFSIRWLLGLTAVCAVVFSVFSMALQGSYWAVGISATVLSLVAAMLVYAMIFALVSVFSLVTARSAKRTAEGGSPFAAVPGSSAAPDDDKQMPATPIILLVLVPMALALGNSHDAIAQTSRSTRGSMGYGLSLDVDTHWLDGPGYRPVRIAVTPLAPVAADRTLRLEFLTRQPWNNRFDLRVQQDLEIPAGTTPATPVQVTLSVPQCTGWQMFSLNVFEDGKLQEKLCIPWSQVASAANVTSWAVAGDLPNILLVGKTLPDTSGLVLAFGGSDYIARSGYVPQTAASSPTKLELPTAATCLPAHLSERWIDYTSLDVVCLSLAELFSLKAERPKALQAILEWTAAGGNLWVYGVGSGRQQLEVLKGLLSLKTAGASADDPKTHGWDTPDQELYGQKFQEAGADSEEDFSVNPGLVPRRTVRKPRPAKPAADNKKPPAEPPFVLHLLGQGLAVALAAEQPFPGQQEQWSWLLLTVGRERLFWNQRHGLSMVTENAEFWNWLIPGVGLAPVTEFCVLITLFVLAIGPLNYWLLRRRRKLHLLVVTIPGGAGAITLALFGYAVLSDGFAIRLRVRSFTQIDQPQQRAVCWARMSYYAGVAPSHGLSFPADVAVFPFAEAPVAGYGGRLLPREMVWNVQQRLTSGWLNSRTPTQYLTVRSRPATFGLEVIEPGEPTGKWHVTNRLDTRIEQLAVRTRDKRLFWATDIEPNATATLEPLDSAAVQSRLSRVAAGRQPANPPGVNPSSYGGLFDFSRRRFFYRPPGTLTQRTSRLEQSLAAIASVDGNAAPVIPGSYVAIVERSPEAVTGITNVREEASFHVIVGRW